MSLKRTLFYDHHLTSGGKMVDFGGWELPIQYTKMREEHLTVRTKAGLFDVSHMGEVFLEGEGALEAARFLVTNDLNIGNGQAQYTCICNSEGGIVDDVIVYCFSPDKVMFCINAANREKDSSWIEQNNPNPQVAVRRASEDYAQVAVQGPLAEQILQKVCDLDLPAISYYAFATGTVAEVDECIVARTGYTGEDGFEVFIPKSNPVRAKALWTQLLLEGKDEGIVPVGLGARDSLRLEAKMNLYGSDMNDQTKPYESGLGWTVKMSKSDFIGKAALEEFKGNYWTQRQVALVMDKKIPRHGFGVFSDEGQIGEVTSGGYSPVLGKGIALARVDRKWAKKGTSLMVEIRGKQHSATVISGAFYKREQK